MNPIAPDPQDHTPQDDALRQNELPERSGGLQREARGGGASVSDLGEPEPGVVARRGRWLGGALAVLVIVAAVGFLGGRYWLQNALRQSLPVVDGRVTVPGLAAPVTV